MGPVLGPHARTDRTWDTRVAEPRLPAPDTRRPRNSRRPTPPGAAPRRPRGRSSHRACTRRGQCRAPHPHPRAHSMCLADPDGPFRVRATGGGTAPDTRRPSQRWRATPPGTAPTTPAGRGPHRACKPRGQRRAPTPAHPRPQQEWMTDPDSPPRGQTVGGGGAPDRRRPSQRTRGPQNPGCPPKRTGGRGRDCT